jgi:hypothetical protein
MVASSITCSRCGQIITVNDGERIVCPYCQEREAARALFAAPTRATEALPAEVDDRPQIEFVCPFCDESYPVSRELAGKKINCRNCYEPCRVPDFRNDQAPVAPDTQQAGPVANTAWSHRSLSFLANMGLAFAFITCAAGCFASLAFIRGKEELFGWLLFSGFILAFLTIAGCLVILRMLIHLARQADRQIKALKKRVKQLDKRSRGR